MNIARTFFKETVTQNQPLNLFQAPQTRISGNPFTPVFKSPKYFIGETSRAVLHIHCTSELA